MARKVAVLIPRVRSRDYSLPPLPKGAEPQALTPEAAEQLSLPTDGYILSDGKTTESAERADQAIAWCAERIEDEFRVYVINPEILIAQFMWYEREYPQISPILDQILEWVVGSQFVPLVELTEIIEGLTDSRVNLIATLQRTDDVNEVYGIASSVNAFILSNQWQGTTEWPRNSRDIEDWISENVRRRRAGGDSTNDRFHFTRPATSRNGLLGTAASILSLSAGLVMSWHGMRIDTNYLSRYVTFNLDDYQETERESRRKLNMVYASLRGDNRVHPYYTLQRFKRLEARNPRYQILSGRVEPDERRPFLPDSGETMYAIDVSLAELFITAIYWDQLFHRTLPNQSGLLLQDMEAHTSGQGADMHMATGNRLMAEIQHTEMIGSNNARKIGKAVNFALGNLGSVQSIAYEQSNKLGMVIDAHAVCHVLKALAQRYPYEAWKKLCRDIAFNSSPRGSNRAIVPTITGRWIPLHAKKGRKVPAPTSVASAMTQSSFADVHAFGLFHAVRTFSKQEQGKVIGSVFDELLVSAPDEEAALRAQAAYIAGAKQILPRLNVRTSLVHQGAYWRA